MQILGEWIDNIDFVRTEFINGKPFENVVIENFFSNEYLSTIVKAFPKETHPNWFKYWNPIEKKYAMNDFTDNKVYKNLFDFLQTDYFVQFMRRITNINNLENDPYLHGAGLHYHPPKGKLDMHLDYSIHPKSGKERRVNLIIYLNENWNESFNGDIQLWDKEFTYPVKTIFPFLNRAVLFKTSDISYHGLPTPINCPITVGRKSIAIYYVSDPEEHVILRKKAEFRKLPWQPENEKLNQLYKIRSQRIITNEDLETIYPNWESEGHGFW